VLKARTWKIILGLERVEKRQMGLIFVFEGSVKSDVKVDGRLGVDIIERDG
jgi:hypothetical protein